VNISPVLASDLYTSSYHSWKIRINDMMKQSLNKNVSIYAYVWYSGYFGMQTDIIYTMIQGKTYSWASYKPYDTANYPHRNLSWYMTIEIVHVLQRSDHAFTGIVNARQARVTPMMHCKENPVQTKQGICSTASSVG
jgi:hypothetical protein